MTSKYLIIFTFLIGVFFMFVLFKNLLDNNKNSIFKISDDDILRKSQSLIDNFDEKICQQDLHRKNYALNLLSDNANTISDHDFYKLFYYPIHSGCQTIRLIGGNWIGSFLGYDGQKYICLDDFLSNQHQCIVYTFGVNNDISFEMVLANYNCEIHSYDHTITNDNFNRMSKAHQNLTIHRKGVASKEQGSFITLENEILRNQHHGKDITYLKIDIEGAEIEVLNDLIRKGLLNKVKQIGVEFHDTQIESNRVNYAKITQKLYQLGFKLISFDANFVANVQKLPRYFELVFRKVQLICE